MGWDTDCGSALRRREVLARGLKVDPKKEPEVGGGQEAGVGLDACVFGEEEGLGLHLTLC